MSGVHPQQEALGLERIWNRCHASHACSWLCPICRPVATVSQGCQVTSWGHFALSLGLLPLCCPLGLHFRPGSPELPLYWKTEAARRDHASGSSPPPQREGLPTAPCIQSPVLGGDLGSCSVVILPLYPVSTTGVTRAPAQIANCLLLLASEPHLWLPSTTLKSCLIFALLL